ncbi:MAG: hypothetical protein DMG11_20840 [Acidobacteria bacterium]|nr:MAG: hypothetical protein DMG11_20840 [Acidobacteriota bacterium]
MARSKDRDGIDFFHDPHGALSAPLIWHGMRAALQVAHAPLPGIKRLSPHPAGSIEGHPQIIAKRRTGASFQTILPVADNPFAGKVS